MKPKIAVAQRHNLLPRLRRIFSSADNSRMPSQPNPQSDAGGERWHRSGLQNLRRNVPKILAATLIAGVLAAAYLFLAKPSYSSTAQLYFDPRETTPVAQDAQDVPYTPDFTYVESQVSVMQSAVVLNRVVEALRLNDDPDYVAKGNRGALSSIATWLSNSIEPVNPAKAARNSLAKTLDITRKLKTYIVTITATASSPSKAVAVVDAVIRAYLSEQNAAAAERLDGLRAKLTAPDAKATGHRKSPETMPPAATVGNLATAHADAAGQKALHDQTQKALKTPAGAVAIPADVMSPQLQTLRDRLTEASHRVTTLSATLGARHPDLIDAKSKVSEIKSEMAAELKRMAAKARADYEAAETHEKSPAVTNAKPATSSSSSARDAPVAGADITASHRLTQAEEAFGRPPLQARIITPPSEPTQPVSPRAKIVLGIGILSGLGFGLAWALVSGALENRVLSIADLKHHLGRGVVVQIPFLTAPRLRVPWPYRITPEPTAADQLKDMMLALGDAHAPDTTGYRQAVLRLLAKVKSQQRPGRPHTVMLVAPRSGAGNSATALALAYSAALAGERVLLVDATSSNPELSTFLAPNFKPGSTIALDSKDDLNAMTIIEAQSGLVVLPIALTDLRLLKTQQRRRLVAGINGLSQNFDLIFVDAGAVLDDEAATCLQTIADHVIVVASSGATTHLDVATTLQLLEPGKDHAISGVLTMAA